MTLMECELQKEEDEQAMNLHIEEYFPLIIFTGIRSTLYMNHLFVENLKYAFHLLKVEEI